MGRVVAAASIEIGPSIPFTIAETCQRKADWGVKPESPKLEPAALRVTVTVHLIDLALSQVDY